MALNDVDDQKISCISRLPRTRASFEPIRGNPPSAAPVRERLIRAGMYLAFIDRIRPYGFKYSRSEPLPIVLAVAD
jgi:hypothetical protein